MLQQNTPVDFVQRALDHSESDLADLVNQAAADPDCKDEERAMVIARSSFALGWREAQMYMINRISADAAFNAITQAVKSLDELALDTGTMEKVTPIRNALVEYRNGDINKRKEFARDTLEQMYGPRTASVLISNEEMDDSTAFDVGLAVATRDTSAFFGFAMFSEDTTLQCRCLGHVAAAMQARNVSPREADAAMSKRFPSRVDAVQAFGRWVITKYNEAFAPLFVPEGGEIGAIDPGSVLEQSHGLFTRLRDNRTE